LRSLSGRVLDNTARQRAGEFSIQYLLDPVSHRVLETVGSVDCPTGDRAGNESDEAFGDDLAL
jgi:hypothetical protein